MVRGRRAVAILCGALIAVVMMGSAWAASGSPTIRKVTTSQFPKVEIVLSAPGSSLARGDVMVTENGRAVDVTGVEPIGRAARSNPVDVMLAVDTSGSMEGTALKAAVDAARLFVRGLPSSIRVGLVAFSDKPHLLVRPTSGHGAALRALRGLVAAGETAMYDAVAAAARAFHGGGQHNLIVLSDGGNTAGKDTLTKAANSASKANATVYTVGLKTPETDVAALRTLAHQTGGTYAPAATADLSHIYAGLAQSISDQFVVTYRSQLGPKRESDVVLTTPAGHDGVVFQTPAATSSPKPLRPNLAEPAPALPSGTAALAVGLSGLFVALFVLVLMALRQRTESQHKQRLARAVRPVERGHVTAAEVPGAVAEGVRRVAEKITEGRVGGVLDPLLERSGLKMRRDELLTLMVAGLVGGAAVGLLVHGAFTAVLFGAAGAVGPLVWVRFKARARLRLIKEHLPEVLSLLASSLRSGHSFLQALDAVAREMDGAPGEEFTRVVTEIRLGRDVDGAMNDLAARIESEDFGWAVLAVNIQREVGGNLAEVLDTVAGTLRERQDVRRQVDVLSAEGRLSVWVLAALPFLFSIYLAFVSPQSLGMLFTTGIGLVMVFGAAVLLVTGILWMKRIVRIDV